MSKIRTRHELRISHGTTGGALQPRRCTQPKSTPPLSSTSAADVAISKHSEPLHRQQHCSRPCSPLQRLPFYSPPASKRCISPSTTGISSALPMATRCVSTAPPPPSTCAPARKQAQTSGSCTWRGGDGQPTWVVTLLVRKCVCSITLPATGNLTRLADRPRQQR